MAQNLYGRLRPPGPGLFAPSTPFLDGPYDSEDVCV